MTARVFPASYDELDVLAHYGATPEELKRREIERADMDPYRRFLLDVQARAHVGPTLEDHRRRWAELDAASGRQKTADGDTSASAKPTGRPRSTSRRRRPTS